MRIGCLGVQPGRMIDQDAIRARYNALGPFLNERDRRLFAACEARAAGRGGIVAVSRTTGIARSTIGRGLADLRSGAMRRSERVRRRGGGQNRQRLGAIHRFRHHHLAQLPQHRLRHFRSERRVSEALEHLRHSRFATALVHFPTEGERTPKSQAAMR